MTRLCARVFAALVLATAVAWLVPAPANAQALYGSVVGTITDTQGAITPGVVVVATNTGTGLKAEATTDANGGYVLRNLLPGTYDLTATLSGFREHTQTAIPVTGGNPVRIDIKLEVGTVSERVEVVSQTTLLQTEKADISSQLTSKEIVNMPLNQYRNYQQLLNLVPGTTPAQFQNAEIDTPGRSLRTWVNGTQPNSNATRIDGAVSVNIWLPHHVGYVQPAETIETVNVSTNNFDADQGMAGGASTTVITKSGTNQVKGSAFEFHNRDEFNANTFYNNANGLKKQNLNTNIFGGTLGGPVVKNHFFYFGSWEKFQDRRGYNASYNVPTAKMRAGDFSEVAAAYSSFRLYNPFTGGAGGVGRELFPNNQIPSGMISPVAQAVMQYYPAADTRDLDRNGLLDDYTQPRQVRVDRNNYDTKFTFQRTASHSVWGKFSVLNANVVDNFNLGWQNGSLGHTRIYVGTVGHTWTLGRSLVLDGNFGVEQQNQTVTGPDYGENVGLKVGIPGTNDPTDIRASGLPTIANGYTIGGTPSWMPLFRKERSYTFSSALTKAFTTKHEIRVGVDVVRHELNHRQAEFGDYGLKGGLSFSNNTTSACIPKDTQACGGYISPGWNNFAGFLLGLPSYYSKDVQTETMTGREWQNAVYIRDRWNVTQKLTFSLGLRAEQYPLMTRATRGLERLDYNTFTALIGGLGDVPKDAGIKMKTLYFAPRVGAMYRLSENSVVRAGYGRTINPLPWSRPMRGSFPQDINFNNSADQYMWNTTLAQGIPSVPVPDISSGRVKLPRGVFMRSPNPNDVDRGIIQQYNVAYEYRLPWDISTEIAYVGTRTDGGYADLNLNYGEPGGGNASRHYYAVAGTSAITDWASRTRSRYNGLQIAVNRPFRNTLALKGAYTLSHAKNMADEDGWVGLDYTHPMVYDMNFSTAGFDRTHNLEMGFVWDMPFLKDRTGAVGSVLAGWQLNGVAAWYSGTPYSIGGTNSSLNCPGCGAVRINVNGDPKPTGTVGSMTEPYYPIEIFSQPTGLDRGGFGNSGRNRFRRPPVWNADMSLFKTFQFGRFRPELRIESTNIFNHTTWGAPVTGFTANNFMRFTPGSTGVTPKRQIRIGVRLGF